MRRTILLILLLVLCQSLMGQMVDFGPVIYPPNFPISATQVTLDAVEEHAAIVIPVPKTGTLKKVGWRLASSTLVGTLAVSIETVADVVGAPVATTDAGKTLYQAGGVSADIVNPTAVVRFDAINGATGIAMTKGDLISVTVRAKAVTSGTCNIVLYGGGFWTLLSQMPYGYTYLGGAGTALASSSPQITLEYDGEFVPVFYGGSGVYPANSTDTYNSGSNPDRRGLKLKYLDGVKLKGAYAYVDTDEDCQLILYDADEYTVVSGFPITIQGNMRRANARAQHFVEFPTEPTLTAGSFYRLVLLPTTVTSIITEYITPSDDGGVLGITSMVGGANFIYTSFNGTPTSGSHAWTDVATQRPGILPVVSQISTGGGAGIIAGAGSDFPVLELLKNYWLGIRTARRERLWLN